MPWLLRASDPREVDDKMIILLSMLDVGTCDARGSSSKLSLALPFWVHEATSDRSDRTASGTC